MIESMRASSGLNRFYKLFSALMRRYRSSMLLYGSILFCVYTLPVLISYFDDTNFEYWAYGAGKNFNGFAFFMFVVYMIVVPIGLGARHFGYMHSKRAVDLFHALPVKRSELYLAESSAGMLVLSVPVVINFSIVMCIQVIAGYARYTPVAFCNMLLWLVAGCTVFAITGLCAVNVGSGLDTSLFSMAMNGAPTAIFMLNQAVKDMMLYGYVFDEKAMIWATRLSPIATMVMRESISDSQRYLEKYSTNGTMLVWLLLSVAITLLSVTLYRRRKSEQAEVVGNLGPAQVVVRALVYYLGAIVFAMIFSGVFDSGYNSYSGYTYFIVGAGVGALLTGIIGEMILTRSPIAAIKRTPVILGVTVVALAGSYIYTRSGFGFETYVPDVVEVKSASIDFEDGYVGLYGRYNGRGEQYFSSPEILEMITSVHRSQVDAYRAEHESGAYDRYRYSYSNFSVTYTMKNGSQVSRRYYDLYADARTQLVRLALAPEYAQSRSEFFQIQPDEISAISLASVIRDNTHEVALTSGQKQSLLEAIRADVLSRDADEMLTGAKAIGIMQVSATYDVGDTQDTRQVEHVDRGNNYVVSSSYVRIGDGPERVTLDFIVYESDQNTLRFLRSNGLLDYITPDFSRVTGLWLINNSYKYMPGGPLMTLNSNMSYEVHDIVENTIARMGEDGSYEGRLEAVPIPVERIDELMAIANATAPGQHDRMVVAFRTDSSVKRTGYLYIDYASLPSDIKSEFDRQSAYGYDTYYYDNFSKDLPAAQEAVPAIIEDREVLTPEAAPSTSVDVAVVPVGTLRIGYRLG